MSRASTPVFAEVFELVSRIELEETDSALITAIADLDVDAEGRLLIAEPAAGEVRLYGPDGRLSRRLGRPGDGPGELRRPAAAAFGPAGGVYTSDTASPRVTRFVPELGLDTVWTLPNAHFGGPLRRLGDGMVIFAMRPGPGAELYDIYGPRGVRLGGFHRADPSIAAVPGWLTAARSRLASGTGSVFVVESLLYPILRYDRAGRLVDSLGVPPPSWRQASRPEPGMFRGPQAWARFARWRRTFTTIAALAVYRDSLLLVAHEELDPDIVAYDEATYRLDVYRLHPQLVKLAEDILLPGPLLHAGAAVYVLLGRPPQPDAWTLGRYEWRGRTR